MSTDRVRRRHVFGPRVVEIAHFLAPQIRCSDTVTLFEQVDHRWPDLSFRDFRGAAVLAEVLTVTAKPAGRA
jgi:hypothetical protein